MCFSAEKAMTKNYDLKNRRNITIGKINLRRCSGIYSEVECTGGKSLFESRVNINCQLLLSSKAQSHWICNETDSDQDLYVYLSF